ncbi:argininosuccinate synthase [Curtobacterium sp. Csp2]|uniref:argininosuccinate synthase domain-containing protein n=1 Tax=Curtobacterium sp. Csp2 TaxID=2495430 RepID=UPI00158073A0|nr:argininosuccinate synthase domain-containing protein [Curtobacterium sp. Csp2]QKS15377.1 argininosuccinate synthase [Curtobacterium sp. Csp2]
MTDRIVVAASAGVDPAEAVARLAHSGPADDHVALGPADREVIALVVDVGGRGRDVEQVRDRARAAGAVDAIVVDAKTEYAERYVVPALRANALDTGRSLVPALRRPLVAAHLVTTARQLGAGLVAHATAAPDEPALAALVGGVDPDLGVVPVPLDAVPTGAEQDLWGRLVPATGTTGPAAGPPTGPAAGPPTGTATDPADDPWAAPADAGWLRTQDPVTVPDPDEVTVTFEHGVPVALDGQRFGIVRLLQELDALAGRHGIGRHDVVVDLRDGRKARHVAETPAATALTVAHRDLERLTLERDVAVFSRGVEAEWARLAVDGAWNSGLRRGLDAFLEQTQQHVSGEVRLRLHGGGAVVTGRRSEQSLYDFELAAAPGATSLADAWARPGRTAARRNRAN